MKLRKVDKDAWQKCCRYCHHYEKGMCLNINNLCVDEIFPIYKIVEDGHLDEALEETLGSVKFDDFKELEYLLRGYKLSEKRISEFKDLFIKCWNNFKINLKDDLGFSVSACYENNLGVVASGIKITNPESYCCKDWC